MYDVNDGIWALRGTKVGIAVVHEGMQAPSLMIGSDGIVTALGNFMPEYYADILAAAYRQDWEGVMQYFQKVMNFDIMMRCPGNNGVAKMKYLASLLGIMEPHTSISTMAVSKEIKVIMQKTADFIRQERAKLSHGTE